MPPFKVEWKGDQVKKDVLRATEQATGETLDAAVSHAQSIAPVLTGAYRGAIQAGPVRTEGEVVRGAYGSTVRYAIYVEIGSRGNPGQHVLRRAGDAEMQNHIRRIKANL